jgi:NTP pyrophosphatase (non-canonical NTP hydrolase)
MKKIQYFMDDVHQWADSTFGHDRKVTAALHHLKQEVPELIDAIEKTGITKRPENGNPEIEFEFADCFILILNAASKYGLTADQLMEIAQKKLQICKERKWGKPDENGVVNHIKAERPSIWKSDQEISDSISRVTKSFGPRD